MEVKVDISGLTSKKFVDSLKIKETVEIIGNRLLNESIKYEVQKVVDYVNENYLRKALPVKTGKLRNSVFLTIDQRYRTRLVIKVANVTSGGKKVPYAAAIELGRRAYIIRPAKATVLKFVGKRNTRGSKYYKPVKRYFKGGNKDVYAPDVHIPAMAGTGIIQSALNRVKSILPAIVSGNLKRGYFMHQLKKEVQTALAMHRTVNAVATELHK